MISDQYPNYYKAVEVYTGYFDSLDMVILCSYPSSIVITRDNIVNACWLLPPYLFCREATRHWGDIEASVENLLLHISINVKASFLKLKISKIETLKTCTLHPYIILTVNVLESEVNTIVMSDAWLSLQFVRLLFTCMRF